MIEHIWYGMQPNKFTDDVDIHRYENFLKMV
jgi:hypothetical protein